MPVGGDEKHVGAIELWHNDPDKSHEMGLVDGYYGTADMFEFNSRHTRFPRAYGLPGRGARGRNESGCGAARDRAGRA